jgi:nucleoside-diphosphate-sugar epimerase
LVHQQLIGESDMASNSKVLVLGATGGIGGEVARQLRDAGWGVRALKRGAAHDSEQRDGILWLRGDAMNLQDVMVAAKGCSVIVHAVNPPGYRRWVELVLPMLDNTVAAGIAEGATIVLPGTVYNYGPDAFPLLAEASPQHPATRKGAIRVEMERRLQFAAERGARVLIVRAGDFFGPQAGNSWFSQGLVKPGRPIRTIGVPGNKGVGHQWSYLPDVARTMVELLARQDTLDRFAAFHMAGHWDADGVQMAQSIQRVVHKRTGTMPRISAFPWALLTLASPFVPTFRQLREMRYLWRQPIRMDNTRLVQVLGHEPHTPLDDAIEATLEGLGFFASALSAAQSLTAASVNAARSALAVSTAASLLACATPEPAPAPLRIDASAPVVSRHDILIPRATGAGVAHPDGHLALAGVAADRARGPE